MHLGTNRMIDPELPTAPSSTTIGIIPALARFHARRRLDLHRRTPSSGEDLRSCYSIVY